MWLGEKVRSWGSSQASPWTDLEGAHSTSFHVPLVRAQLCCLTQTQRRLGNVSMPRRKVESIYHCLIHTSHFEALCSLSPKLPGMLQLNALYVLSTA